MVFLTMLFKPFQSAAVQLPSQTDAAGHVADVVARVLNMTVAFPIVLFFFHHIFQSDHVGLSSNNLVLFQTKNKEQTHILQPRVPTCCFSMQTATTTIHEGKLRSVLKGRATKCKSIRFHAADGGCLTVGHFYC